MADKLKVTQIRSSIGWPENQRATLVALGLNKPRRSRVVDATPENLGRIGTVRHLVEVEPVEGK
jgi:large subunit ribosomal protein L30